MGAVPFPTPPAPITTPGGWDPAGELPDGSPNGPTVGQVWRNIKESAGVGDSTKAEPRVEADDTDCSQTSNKNQCNACKLAQGFIVPANYTIPHKQYRNFDYQVRIANRFAAPEQFGYTYGGSALDRARIRMSRGKNEITVSEWLHGGIRFDGFWRDVCTAVEAKGHYKQFFNSDADLYPWAIFDRKQPNILESWERQAKAHYHHISRLGSPAKIEWHFLEIECLIAAKKQFGHISGICRHSP